MKLFVLNLLVLLMFSLISVFGQHSKTDKDTFPAGIDLRNMSNERYVQLADSFKMKGTSLLQGTDFNGHILPMMQLRPVTIVAPFKLANPVQADRYSKLVRYVKIVYPYSKLIKKTYTELQANLLTIKTEKDRKEYLKKAEKELRNKFEDQLVKLSVTQGRILLKLVDRELGVTTFEVIKELRGSFQAFFWQSIAKVFGSNLKSTYDKVGEDAMIEDIIIRIENGLL